jgi:hypothetical protein
MIEDLWPDLDDFDEVLDAVEIVMAEDAEALDGQTTGSEHRMEAIAERARIAEKRQARRQAKLEAKAAKEAAERREETPAVETTVSESTAMLDDHDWLVE